MFPLKFPLGILRTRATAGDRVLDPFCGRGTTNFAARLLGFPSLGIDSSPVAVAITAAKLACTSAAAIVSEAKTLLANGGAPEVPCGEFWARAYHPTVLKALCVMRRELSTRCDTDERLALRGIILGALHGPQQKTFPSYFSNQCPRTYAPKPAYALQYWRRHGLQPENVDVLSIIERRARRYYASVQTAHGTVRLGDSRVATALQVEPEIGNFDWVITSPPYYGMRTYVPDQWLRSWFLGGPPHVDYQIEQQLTHLSPDHFISDLRKVWRNAARVCADGARMVIRFGGIAYRKTDPIEIIKTSLQACGWRVQTCRDAGLAPDERRQANTFLRTATKQLSEYDVWAVREN